MKKKLMAFALMIAVINGFSQNGPAIMKNMVTGGDKSDEMKGMDATIDKGMIIAATTLSANNSMITRRVANSFTDALVMRYDPAGNLMWSKCYGGSKADVINDIRQTADGGFIAVGRSYSTDYDLPSSNDSLYSNLWVLKLSAIGDIEWSRVFGGKNIDEGASVIQIADGNYVIAGYTGSPGNEYGSVKGESDLLIIKLDVDGNNPVFKRYGGSRNDVPAKIIQLSNGNYVVVGDTKTPNDGIITGNHSTWLTQDIWVVWLDNNLDHLENRCYGGTGIDYGTDVLELSNGDLLIAGIIAGPNDGDIHNLPRHGGYEGWMARINRSIPRPNDIVWARPYGGNKNDFLRSMVKTPDDNIIIGMQTSSNSDPMTDIWDSKGGATATISDVWLAKVNPANGAIISRRSYGTTSGDDLGQIILQEEGIVFGGTLLGDTRDADLAGQPAYGGMDIWIARLADSAGIVSRVQTVTSHEGTPVEKMGSFKMYLKSNSMIVNYTSSEKQAGVVQLLDINGQLLKSYKVTWEKGYQSLELNTGILSASKVYVGVLIAGDKKHSIKMVK